jgi:hypothetical protein
LNWCREKILGGSRKDEAIGSALGRRCPKNLKPIFVFRDLHLVDSDQLIAFKLKNALAYYNAGIVAVNSKVVCRIDSRGQFLNEFSRLHKSWRLRKKLAPSQC